MLQKIRELSKHLAIYGAGDVAIQALNFLLLPFYVRYLSQADYGVLALLASIEATVKLFFRWGVDGAFMRFWYDCEDERARQRLRHLLGCVPFGHRRSIRRGSDRSRKISCAALWPGAPVTPPPGCVPDPHI